MTPFIVFIVCIACYVLPTLFNFIIVTYKRKKTFNKMCKNLEEKGYKIADNRIKNNIFEQIISFKKTQSEKNGIIKGEILNYINDISCWWMPFINLFYVNDNFKYLFGNYTGYNEVYITLENLSLNDDVIELLVKEKLIEKDLEKQKWLVDRDAALKELEEKYDNVNVDENVNLYSFSEKDSTDELYKKLEQLQEMIERKEADKNNNKSDTMTLQKKQRI